MRAVGRASTVFKGNAFEHRSLRVLEKHLSMSLRHVGGNSDGGVDLIGWWWLPPFTSSSDASPEASDISSRQRVRVLAQCKAHTKKLGPSTVRELEGVLSSYRRLTNDHLPSGENLAHSDGSAMKNPVILSAEEGPVALLISQSQFTRQTALRAMSSSVPFLLLHLPDSNIPSPSTTLISESGDLASSNTNENENGPRPNDGYLGAALWNAALGGPSGLLRGQFEMRWIRSIPAVGDCTRPTGRPSLWWNGSMVKSWVPEEANSCDVVSSA
jgi:hypothetical protein